ncbi:MAG: neutral zinc metallopeptidase [Neisseriaceae bacterium]|nr:neutral zinc metallopeptidase [Neisseriaceae bacterium]
MRWQGRRSSTNVEDRRGGMSTGGKIGGGIIGFILLLVGSYYGVDLSGVARLLDNGASQTTANAPIQESAEEKQLKEFSTVVLAETEDTWNAYFARAGKKYSPPTLVLYRGQTQTACGAGQAVMGPFYCPADQKVYLDLSFYDDMKNQLHASGEFAMAYVIAHEVGHHVQNLLGISHQTQAAMQRTDKVSANKISVLVELQADCFAGVWAHDVQNKNLLEAGDAEAAFRAAEAVGDDRLQQQSQGRVVPDSFTHGSSAQRLAMFRRGLNSGDPNQCDTFSQSGLSIF